MERKTLTYLGLTAAAGFLAVALLKDNIRDFDYTGFFHLDKRFYSGNSEGHAATIDDLVLSNKPMIQRPKSQTESSSSGQNNNAYQGGFYAKGQKVDDILSVSIRTNLQNFIQDFYRMKPDLDRWHFFISNLSNIAIQDSNDNANRGNGDTYVKAKYFFNDSDIILQVSARRIPFNEKAVSYNVEFIDPKDLKYYQQSNSRIDISFTFCEENGTILEAFGSIYTTLDPIPMISPTVVGHEYVIEKGTTSLSPIIYNSKRVPLFYRLSPIITQGFDFSPYYKWLSKLKWLEKYLPENIVK